MSIFRAYIIDFFIWYYLVKAKEVLKKILSNILFVLSYLNIIPMLQNLFVPLFQDTSWQGKMIAFPIRLTWVFVGTVIMLIYLVFMLFVIISFLLLPFFPFISLLLFK